MITQLMSQNVGLNEKYYLIAIDLNPIIIFGKFRSPDATLSPIQVLAICEQLHLMCCPEKVVLVHFFLVSL